MQQGRASQRAALPATARFVLLTDQPRKVNRGSAPAEPRRVTWTLIAANNRPLGRAARLFDSVESCLADTGQLLAGLAQASSTVVFHEAQRAATSYWSWTVYLDSVPRAVSAFRYQRRLECEGSLRRFLGAAGTANVGSSTVFRLGARLRTAFA